MIRSGRVRISLFAITSILLLSASAVLFSASLNLGIALENDGRRDHAALLLANHRYWSILFPFQLIALTSVSIMLLSLIPEYRGSGRARRWAAAGGVMLILLFLDYAAGIMLFDRWGSEFAEYLKRL